MCLDLAKALQDSAAAKREKVRGLLLCVSLQAELSRRLVLNWHFRSPCMIVALRASAGAGGLGALGR